MVPLFTSSFGRLDYTAMCFVGGLNLWFLANANAPVLSELMRIDEYFSLKGIYDSMLER